MKRFLYLLFIILFVSVTTKAQWSSDPTVNTAVSTLTTTSKSVVVAVTDGAGGMFVAWIDNNTSIYIQRVLPNGTLKFSPEVVVSNATGATSSTKSNLVMISDGAGGAICAWQDARNTTSTLSNNDIYGQRIDGNGNSLWTSGGVRLSVSNNSVSTKVSPLLCLLSTNEAAVLFGDNRGGNSDIYAQKISTTDGSFLWANDISIHGAQANSQTPSSADIVADHTGGFFVSWSDPRLANSNADIYVQRVDNSGNLLWGSGGTNICNAANNQNFPKLVIDNAGGIITTWLDLRVTTDINIYAQRVNSAGLVQWAANGVVICAATGAQNNPLIINAGTNFIISWADNRVSTSDRNIYAQSITSSGSVNWATDGVAICTATGNQPSTLSGGTTGMYMIENGNNGALIFWDDARNGSSNTDIYAQNINSAGIVQWTTNGVPVCTAATNQSTPVAILAAPGVSLVAWRDSRTSANGSIYASRLSANGTLFSALSQTIIFNALPAKTYGDADFDAAATSTNSTIPIAYSSSNTSVAVIQNGLIHIVGAGTATITASQAGDAVYSAAADVSQTLTVNKALLTIKADDKTRNEGFPDPVFTFSYSGFVNGENATNLTSLPSASTTATITSPPSTYPIVPSGAASNNYNITYQNGTLTINAYTIQVITFGTLPTKKYGDADFAPGATSNSSDFPITYTSSNTNVATIVGGKIHIVGAGITTITASQSGDATHQAAINVSQNLTITKADLAISADNKTKYVGQANPPLTISYSGFVNGEAATNLTLQAAISTTATASSPAGTYPINVNGAISPNYNITHIPGTLTVNPLINQTITFNVLPAKAYGDADFVLTGNSTNNTIPITFTSANPAVATISGTVVHIVGAGTTTITASQASSIPYNAATDVSQTLTVSKAPLTITADNKVKNEGEPMPVLTANYNGFVNGENANNITTKPVVTTTATANSGIGTYSINANGALSNNYSFTYIPGKLTVLPSEGNTKDKLLVFAPNSSSITVRIYINTQLYGAIKSRLRLIDQNGRVVVYKEALLNQGFTDVSLPVSGVSSGSFVISVAVGTVFLSTQYSLIRQ